MSWLSKPAKVILALGMVISISVCGYFLFLGDYAIQNNCYQFSLSMFKRSNLYFVMDREVNELYQEISDDLTKEHIQEHLGIIHHPNLRTKVSVNNKVVFSNLSNQKFYSINKIEQQYHFQNNTLSVKITARIDFPLQGQDLYTRSIQRLSTIYTLRYAVWIAAGICGGLALIFAVLLIRSAGHRYGSTELYSSSFLNVFPASVILILYTLLLLTFHLLTPACNALLMPDYHLAEIIFGMLLCPITVWCCCLLTIKLRTHTIRSSSILYYISTALSKKKSNPAVRQLTTLWNNLELWKKTGLLILLVSLIDTGFMLSFTFLSPTENSAFFWIMLSVWGLSRIFLLVFSGLCVLNLQILKNGAERIRDGGLAQKLNTDNMFWEFREYADILNCIGDGMQKAAEEKMKGERFQTELITNVSHDIKTPLTSIINYIDLLDKLQLHNPQAKQYIAILTRNSARLKKLTEDLIEASKAQNGRIQPDMEKIDYAMLINQASGEYADRLAEANLQLILHLPEQPVIIEADGKLLWRVLDNLMSNICKYALSGTRVFIDLTSDGICSLKNISREELNISSEELAKRFVRGDTSRSETQGSGLGLSIALSLTELMGGRLLITIDGDLFKAEVIFPILTDKIDKDDR